jgi:predicted Na+-dependent transporter
MNPTKVKRVMLLALLGCLISLASFVIFCVGCSTHEYSRQGQAQDWITHLLALGTYFSLCCLLGSGILFLFNVDRLLMQRLKNK